MRVDGDDLSESISSGDGSKHDRRFAFEAANFDDGALRGSTGSQCAEEAKFILSKETWNGVSALKRDFYCLIEIVGQSNHQICPQKWSETSLRLAHEGVWRIFKMELLPICSFEGELFGKLFMPVPK